MSKKNLEKVSEVEKFEAFRDERSLVTIATFVDGFAAGWKMAVPEAFRNALDIKSTPRVFDGKTRTEITQGKNFSFKETDVLYDTRDAYQLWSKALNKISLCATVLSATPASLMTTSEFETIERVSYKKNDKKAETPKKLCVRKNRMNYGAVRFCISRPNSDKTKLVDGEIYETDQENFVYFLQSGILRTSGEIIKLL